MITFPTAATTNCLPSFWRTEPCLLNAMIVLYILAVLVLCFVAALLFTYKVAFYAPKENGDKPIKLPGGEQYLACKETTDALYFEMRALPFERVYITSKDGLRLSAIYYQVRPGAPLQIQVHGYRGSAYRDFCGGNHLARELGHNTLVLHQRGHGESGGRTITFGIKERQDLMAWIHYANTRFGSETPIFLSGVSMGASTVLMAAELGLPENVVGITADSPFTSPAAVIEKVCGDMGLPKKPAMWLVRLAARWIGKFDLDAASAISAIGKSPVPVLLIHGEDDRFVPCAMSHELYQAAGEKAALHIFPGAGHGLSYIIDPGRYQRIFEEFEQACLKNFRALK